jgi:hypothetical protein
VFERATSFLIVVVLLGGCARREAPDVVLVTFDTTRYDHFGCTGDPEAHTPIVDGPIGAMNGVLRRFTERPIPDVRRIFARSVTR